MPNIYTYYCQTRCKTDFEIANLPNTDKT